MDRNISPKILEVYVSAIDDLWGSEIRSGSISLAVGMEVAGGMLVSQMASCEKEFMSKLGKMDCLYMRKKRKTSGTRQQLEGLNEYTKRTSDSPQINGRTLLVIINNVYTSNLGG